jgi:hypothetical protein
MSKPLTEAQLNYLRLLASTVNAGLRPKSDCSGEAQKQLYSNLQTRPLVREGATNLHNRKCLKKISRRKKNWSQVCVFYGVVCVFRV